MREGRLLTSDAYITKRSETERICYNLQKTVRITETIINRAMAKPAR